MIGAFLWGALAASSLLIGYFLSERGLSNRNVGLIMGFGAGALISAIAYELVPEAAIGGEGMFVAFVLGALVFFAGSGWWNGGAGPPQEDRRQAGGGIRRSDLRGHHAR
jgi:ZIP family zinc transporter